MADSLTAAISYGHDPIEIDGNSACYEIAVASCLADDVGAELMCRLRWVCPMPDPNRYVEQPYGSSETIGLLGGISQLGDAANSEALERALGDGITLAFAQILDLDDGVQTILVKGPVLPKVLGRFLSLHPPSEKVIAWISPGGHDSRVGHPPGGTGKWPRRLVSFRGEGLITCIPFARGGRDWWVEYIDLDGSNEMTKRVISILSQLKSISGAGMPSLPRELEFGTRVLPSSKDLCFVGPGKPPESFNPPKELVGERGLEIGRGRGRVIYPWLDA